MTPLLLSIYANIRDFYDKIFWRRPGAVNEKGDGWVLNYAGGRMMSGANQLWIDHADAFNAGLLDYALRFFRRYRAEWSILVVPEVYPDLLQRCYQNGCVEGWSHSIMAFEGKFSLPCYPHNIRIESIWNNIQRYHASHILSEAFHMDADAAQHIFRHEHTEDTNLHHYIAYYANYPAAVSTLTFTDGMAGIWNVGTRRAFRRRCLAHALMGRMVDDAEQQHLSHSMLIASNQGQPIYEKLGYRTVATIYYMAASVY